LNYASVVSNFSQGHNVRVSVRGGDVYTGLLHGVDIEKDFSLVLKWATKQSTDLSAPENRPVETLLVQGSDLVEVYAADVLMISHPAAASAVQMTTGNFRLLLEKVLTKNRFPNGHGNQRCRCCRL
jgi:small nuclear ribonucleoprotein (snRNP)-like protein